MKLQYGVDIRKPFYSLLLDITVQSFLFEGSQVFMILSYFFSK